MRVGTRVFYKPRVSTKPGFLGHINKIYTRNNIFLCILSLVLSFTLTESVGTRKDSESRLTACRDDVVYKSPLLETKLLLIYDVCNQSLHFNLT